jgi:hypothetical protein
MKTRIPITNIDLSILIIRCKDVNYFVNQVMLINRLYDWHAERNHRWYIQYN